MSTKARYVRDMPDGNELWEKGIVAFVIPKILPTDSPELRRALDIRRQATLTGRCQCGAVGSLTEAGYALTHEDDCPACDINIFPMAQRER